MEISDAWIPLDFPSLRLVHTEPLAIHQLQFRVPTLALVPVEVSAPVGCDSLYLPVFLSNVGGRGLSCDLTSLTDLRRVVAFSVCLAFYLLGRSGDF